MTSPLIKGGGGSPESCVDAENEAEESAAITPITNQTRGRGRDALTEKSQSRNSSDSSGSSNQAEGSADGGGGSEEAAAEGAAPGTRATADAEAEAEGESRAAADWVDGAESRCRSGASPGSLASRCGPSRSGQHVLPRHVRSMPPHGYWQPTPSCEQNYTNTSRITNSCTPFSRSRSPGKQWDANKLFICTVWPELALWNTQLWSNNVLRVIISGKEHTTSFWRS